MKNFTRFILCLCVALNVCLFTGTSAFAHGYKLGDLYIAHPWARSTVPGQPAAGAFLGVENNGKSDDKLLRASSPEVKTVELHTMSMDNNVMRMRQVDSIDLPAGSKLKMQPGSGYHIMLIGLQQPLKAGDKVPLTLEFEKAGKIDVSLSVEAVKKPAEQKPSTEPASDHKH